MTKQEFISWLQNRFELDGEKIVNKTSRREVIGSMKTDGYYRVDWKFVDENGRRVSKGIGYHRLKFLLAHGYLPPLVDHINGLKTDSRIANLRASTLAQNSANSVKQRNGKSPFKGVHPSRNGKYVAQCRGKHLGIFTKASDAARAYDQRAREIWGAHACVNFPAHPGERSAI